MTCFRSPSADERRQAGRGAESRHYLRAPWPDRHEYCNSTGPGNRWAQVYVYGRAGHSVKRGINGGNSQNVKTPLAGGERIFTRWGYREFLEKRALRVLQPDLGTVGGLTEGKKVADMANIYDVFIQYHTCGSPIALAAAAYSSKPSSRISLFTSI